MAEITITVTVKDEPGGGAQIGFGCDYDCETGEEILVSQTIDQPTAAMRVAASILQGLENLQISMDEVWNRMTVGRA